MMKAAISEGVQKLEYYLAEHPTIVTFRWSPTPTTQSLASTWSFLFASISLYIISTLLLHALLTLFNPTRRRIPLGPIPALHSLLMALLSFTILTGILLSAAAEIRDTRWLWSRASRTTNTPFQWLLCFPLGTRPSGRVFFWSYAFYLSRYLLLIRTPLSLLTHRRLPTRHLFTYPSLIFMAFLWLEFSQSFHVLAIIFTTLVSSVIYGYRFWTAVGLPSACFPFVLNCQMVLLLCNVVAHFGVLLMHFMKGGGCNGIGAWGLNSVLNSAILIVFLNFYAKSYFNNKNDLQGEATTKLQET